MANGTQKSENADVKSGMKVKQTQVETAHGCSMC